MKNNDTLSHSVWTLGDLRFVHNLRWRTHFLLHLHIREWFYESMRRYLRELEVHTDMSSSAREMQPVCTTHKHTWHNTPDRSAFIAQAMGKHNGNMLMVMMWASSGWCVIVARARKVRHLLRSLCAVKRSDAFSDALCGYFAVAVDAVYFFLVRAWHREIEGVVYGMYLCVCVQQAPTLVILCLCCAGRRLNTIKTGIQWIRWILEHTVIMLHCGMCIKKMYALRSRRYRCRCEWSDAILYSGSIAASGLETITYFCWRTKYTSHADWLRRCAHTLALSAGMFSLLSSMAPSL